MIKEYLLVLWLNTNIANKRPGEPPKKAIKKSVFSEILRLFLIAKYLSYPAEAKVMLFTIKKKSNKIGIGLKFKQRYYFSDIIYFVHKFEWRINLSNFQIDTLSHS